MDYEVGKGKPPKHTQFQKGQSGNPDGARKHDPAMRAMRNLDRLQLWRILETLLSASQDELEILANDRSNTPIMDVMIAKAFLKSVENGDMAPLDCFLDRLHGKAHIRRE